MSIASSNNWSFFKNNENHMENVRASLFSSGQLFVQSLDSPLHQATIK
jgi:hypothetical protein